MAKTQTEKLPKSEIEITGSFSAEELKPYRKKAVEALGKDVEVKGFRKGHVPEDVLIKEIGEVKILEEMFLNALNEAYPKLLAEHKIPAIGQPHVSITKIAPGEGVEFSVRTAYLPEITPPDYKKIREQERNQTTETEEVTDKEIEEVIEEVKKRESAQAQEAIKEGKPAPEKMSENEDQLKEKVRESLAREKEMAAVQKRRGRILDTLAEQVDVELPNVLIENELNRMTSRVEHDLSRMGMKFEDYLKQIGKTREQMQDEWRPQAEKNAKTQMALATIAQKENLSPDEDKLKEESKKLAEANNVAEDQARAYLSELMTNEAVLKYLEGSDEKDSKEEE